MHINKNLTRIGKGIIAVLSCFFLTSCLSSIDVRSHPPGAKVLINGVDSGKKTPAKFNVRSLRNGTYTFNVEKEGYNVLTEPQEIMLKLILLKSF